MKDESKAKKAKAQTPESGADVAENAEKVKKAVKKLGGRAALAEKFGKTTIVFSKPLTWCEETYTKAELDFEALTGRDMEAIDMEIGAVNMRGLVPAYSRLYQRLLCARASGIPADAIEHLPLVDYNAMVTAAERFLLVTG